MTIQKNSYAIMLISIFFSCSGSYTPKPKGLLRIDIPEAHYQLVNVAGFPYSFEASQLTTVEIPEADSLSGWLNICYPSLRTKIHCSYRHIFPEALASNEEDCRKLVVRATKNADDIREQRYEDPEKRVYATLFTIAGESVSPVQFMITDSVSHFFRGALYYQENCRYDSISPVTEYIKNDIIELIQSFSWK